MSIKVSVYNKKAEKVSDLKLSSSIFSVEKNDALLHQAMLAQMGNERQVLAHTKGRSDVRGGGKKPWNQKGTGRARAGTSRSPIWIGGGVTFGPRNDRNFSKNINKKMKRKTVLMVLSDKLKEEKLVVIDEIVAKEFKTKEVDSLVSKLEEKVLKNSGKRSVAVVIDKKDEKFKMSGRNLTGLKIINIENINLLDLLKYRDLVLTVGSAKKIEEKYKK
jgi:large subunit ribosomal protein L4